ncbi:class I adenylate-forming enzyme family protein [Sphingomonas abaci]|uniref:Acyl-CoA synthetase (AMP-forming)/AMP-acid ligase II n=1 Tax=Sphingomonas abaci TaxID=237611 RepID=A0A7W7EX88_9SPHN|nr:class I adenylate-forming enzyme family protein [Sphingomonas abaci]MBB4617418.1 acyl-CoA synthetase (AMP-forming)/AMP-acid ligase II [Sphingomonas abaci]
MVGLALDQLAPCWPALSLAEVEARLTAPGMPFEMTIETIRGTPMRVWKTMPPTLAHLLTAARVHGDRPFTIHEEERVSYEANHRAVGALATYLRSQGIGPGDRVALAMRNLPEWPMAFFAITVLGAICVPLNAWWTGGELAYGLADSGARLLIADGERHERIAPYRPSLPDLKAVLVARATTAMPDEERLESVIGTPADWSGLPGGDLPTASIMPDDDATIFYTSGTTGAPKGAVGTHRSLLTNILSSAYSAARTALRRGEMPPVSKPRVALTVIPMFHVTACSAHLMAAVAGGSTTIFMRRWDTVRAMEIIERERVTVTGGVPTIACQLLDHPDRARYDLSSLEAIAYGGAPAAPDLAERIHQTFGALPACGWGMTETSATVTHHGGEDYLNRPTSAGPPVAVADLKIMDTNGTSECPRGMVGELWSRGPMNARGYWNKPEATAETFVDGWVRTGDLARLDEEGFLYIVDRAKDMVIRGGENIYSIEVENALYDHPAIVEAALLGRPHRVLGEEPVAVVHLAPGASAGEVDLQAWLRERLAAFKVPVAIRFLAEPLPRNANGKIVKRDLRALFEPSV